MYNIHKYVWLLLLPLLVLGHQTQAQSYVETFGQNRVQTRKFDWKFFDTKHFRVYHYDRAGRQLGRYVAEEAENNIKFIEKKMGGQFPDRFSIVLYNSYDDYRQTNIGLKDESQISQTTISGTWSLVGDKLLVYHTGRHNDLRRQIQTGMATVVMQRMIFGESFKKMAKTALLKNLPEWVTTGFITYLTDGWNTDANSEWKRLLDARPKTGFHELSEQYPEIAGKAFWKFIHEQYGTDKMKSLLADMQQKTSLNKSMKDKANLGIKVTKAYDSCLKYYKLTYALDSVHQELPDSANGLIAIKVPKNNTIIRNIMLSPRGSEIAYVSWKEGLYTIYKQKTAGDQVSTVLLEGGAKDLTSEIDPNHPMMAWSNGGNKLAILYRDGRKTKLRIYNSVRNRLENYVIPPNRFDRVLGMTFNQDDDKLVFSAIRKSQTDLYSFTIKGSKMVNITDDAWDDVDPVFVSGGARKGILFLSNRPKPNLVVPVGVNQLPTGPMNVYFYNTTTQRAELLQCTQITKGIVSKPIQYGPDHFAYLSDSNGIFNRFVVMFGRDKNNMDSAYSLPVTNYNTSIINHQFNLASGDVADVIQIKDKYMVYFHNLYIPNDTLPAKTLTQTLLSIEKPEPELPATLGENVSYNRKVVTADGNVTIPEVKNGNEFQTEFTDTTESVVHRKRHKLFGNHNEGSNQAATPKVDDSSTLAVITDSAYIKMKPAPYRLNFKPDFFNVRLDNSILFTQYQPYANNGGQYVNPPVSALTTITLNELMEDHKIVLGFQLPLNLTSSAYFIQYKNTKHRLDWDVLFLRTQRKEAANVAYVDNGGNVTIKSQLFKNITNMVQGGISYPIDRLRSIKVSTALRQDRLVQKASDILSLQFEIPNTEQYWSLSRSEYIFDNTVTPLLNIRKGNRYKLYTEYMHQLNGQKQTCINFGLDFRNYLPLYKNAILATRVAYAHSNGTSPVEYQLGGVDNWLFPKSANNGGGAGDVNYGFIAQETSLRGYRQAARKGNNFAVLTTEGRLPIMNTFVKRPVQSAILKNLQFVAFADLGTAWKGFLPQGENLSSTYSYPQLGSPPSGYNNVFLNLTVPNSSGIGVGYGAGLRTTLFGYFTRFDVAWNIDGGKKPMYYLAIGTDF